MLFSFKALRSQSKTCALLGISFGVVIMTGCGSKPTPSAATNPPESLTYENNLFEKVRFISHRAPSSTKKSSSYLAMNLDHQAFSSLREALETKLNRKLLHRDESHITVITPPEFTSALMKKIKMADIEAIAAKMKIQEIPFKPICIGRGSASIKGIDQQTYYVVVQSDQLFQLRRAIQNEFIKRGGKAEDFNADNYFPHITLGFTERDLHESDGVIKDERSCLYLLHSGQGQ